MADNVGQVKYPDTGSSKVRGISILIRSGLKLIFFSTQVISLPNDDPEYSYEKLHKLTTFCAHRNPGSDNKWYCNHALELWQKY